MKEGFKGGRQIILPPMVVEMGATDPLIKSLYITDIGYYPHADMHYRERNEPIAEYVLIYCIEGCGWYRVEEQIYNVRANQYFILPSNQPHIYAADQKQPWTIYWIHFRGEHAHVYAQGAGAPHDISPAMNSRISERNNIFEDIFSTLTYDQGRESLRYASSLLHYYLASLRYLNHYRHQTLAPNTDKENIVEAVQHYMEENIERHLTLEDLAHYTGYSITHLSHLFRQQTQTSPLNYFNQLKIQCACLLLRNTNMKINQICHKVGIEDCYYFSRLFRLQIGCSPRQYRNQQKH